MFYIPKFSSENKGLSKNSLTVISKPPAIRMVVDSKLSFTVYPLARVGIFVKFS